MRTTVQDLADLSREDVFDARDLVERLEEIEAEILDDEGAVAEDADEDLRDERNKLIELIDEIDRYSGDGTRYGTPLIAEWAFEDYARQLAEDIGAIDRDAGWPSGFIDWKRAAEALQQDYTSIDILGQEFWYR